MRHPFDLNLTELKAIDLDFVEPLTDDDAAQVEGGRLVTTLALGEEGGFYPRCRWSKPPLVPRPIPVDPPVTTLAIGEEGGEW